MSCVSVVIITRNEENNIVDCIRSAKLVSDDIVIVDAQSTDNTVSLAERQGARAYTIAWQGYGHSRNFGASKARHSWILALDADERVSPELAESINRLAFTNPSTIYSFRRENYLATKKIRFGTLGFEKVRRLYHRDRCYWDLTLVHEKLLSKNPVREKIGGHIIHFGLKSLEDYRNKSIAYARMSAEKYLLEGKKAGLAKRIFSPAFNSVKSYIFQFGFLDGVQGFRIARMIAWYSWLKYTYLNELAEDALNQPEAELSLRFTSRKVETVSH